MPSWGPTAQSVGPGSSTPDTREVPVHDSGVFAAGAYFASTGTVSTTFSGGRSDAVWWVKIRYYDAADVFLGEDLVVRQPLASPSASWSQTISATARRFRVWWGGALYAGQTVNGTLSGSDELAGHCQYGTEPIDSSLRFYTLTPELIGQVLAEHAAQWLLLAFAPLYYTIFGTDALCSKQPPPMPVLNFDTLTKSPDTLTQLWEAIAWPHFCRCISGVPAPTPYPPPVVVQPPGVPPPLTFP